MRFYANTRKASTFIKYLFSYVALFSILIMAFFLILRSQLEDKYYSQRTDQILQQLSSIESYLDTEMIFLAQIDELISSNPNIKLATYTSEGKYFRVTNEELVQYAKSSTLIHSIVYYSRYSGHVFSTGDYASFRDGVFTLTNLNAKKIEFDPAPYYNKPTGQLIFLHNEETEYLLYFPCNRSKATYLYFYVLDTNVLQSQIKGLVSDEVPAVGLVDNEGNYVTGNNFKPYASALKERSLVPGIHPLDSSQSLCVSAGLRNDFSLVAILSNEFLSEQVNSTFLNAYISLLVLSILGIILIYIAMVTTYSPLKKLIQTVDPASTTNQNYVERLSTRFTELTDQKEQLQQSLASYRLIVQKNLLDSTLAQQFEVDSDSLNRVFEAVTLDSEVLAINVSGIQSNSMLEHTTRQLAKALENIGRCFCLGVKEQSAFYLLLISSHAGYMDNIRRAATMLHIEHKLLFAFSDSSKSILDIPLLYQHADVARSRWPHPPLAEYSALNTTRDRYIYPHNELNQLSVLLENNQFTAARDLIHTVYNNFEFAQTDDTIPRYFLNCINLDLLTIITQSISKAHIAFETYGDVFTEAVQKSRSSLHSRNMKEIHALVNELLFCYEKEVMNRLLHIVPLQQMVTNNYCDPNFSISVIAEAYHVSPSHMSTLFKKEMGIGFAEYIWKMRLLRAKELLLSTDMPIDEISTMIGYYTPNSFRRKFKQETGFTPSQFRETQKGSMQSQ